MSDTTPLPENPYRSGQTGHGKPGMGLPQIIGYAVLLVVVVGLLIALLLPAKRSAREAARHNSCFNNVRQIQLALLNYESAHGELPPAYTVDAEGKRLHSWRTLILPYMEGNTVYEMVDLTKPWDHVANADARQVILEEYLCPSSPVEGNFTNYVAVVGPECVFEGNTPCELVDIKDGTSNTLMIVEVADRQIEWMEPRDLSLDELLALSVETKTNHPHTLLAGFVDGHADTISVEIDHKVLRAMATKAGREPIDEW